MWFKGGSNIVRIRIVDTQMFFYVPQYSHDWLTLEQVEEIIKTKEEDKPKFKEAMGKLPNTNWKELNEQEKIKELKKQMGEAGLSMFHKF